MFHGESDETPALASAASGGDVRAFAALVDRYAVVLMVLVRRRAVGLVGGDWGEDDVLQVVVARMWELLGAFEWRGEAAFRRWLAALVHGACSDRRRYLDAKGRGDPLAFPGGDRGRREPIDSTTAVSVQVQRREEIERVERALALLPASQQEVVVAHVFESRTLAEIASELGVSRNAVFERLHRGMKAIRARLAPISEITP